MMKAWEAKATKRAANATGFTLMAVSLAACNDSTADTSAADAALATLRTDLGVADDATTTEMMNAITALEATASSAATASAAVQTALANLRTDLGVAADATTTEMMAAITALETGSAQAQTALTALRTDLGVAADASTADMISAITALETGSAEGQTALAALRTDLGVATNASTADMIAAITALETTASNVAAARDTAQTGLASLRTDLGLAADASTTDMISAITGLETAATDAAAARDAATSSLAALRTDLGLAADATTADMTSAITALETAAANAANDAVLALGITGVSTLADLAAAYDALANPTVTSFTLTTGTDTVTCTAGNDTILASGTTLGSDDYFVDLGGVDTLKVSVAPTAATSVILNFTGVENIEVSNVGSAAQTYLMTNASGVTSVTSKLSFAAGDVVFSDLQANATIVLDGSKGDVTADFANAVVVGATDAATISIKNDASTDLIAIGDEADEFETINIVVGAGKNSITDIEDSASADLTETTKLVISGSGQLTLGEVALADGAEIDGSDATGKLLITVDATVDKLTGGTGDDTFTLTVGDFGSTNAAKTIDGGAGSDTVVVAADLAASDFDAKSGGTHTIKAEVVRADFAAGASEGADVTRAVDVAGVTGVTKVISKLSNADSGGDDDAILAITGLASGATVDVTASQTGDAASGNNVTIALENASGTSSEVTFDGDGVVEELTMVNTADDTSTVGIDEAGDIEILTITSSDVNETTGQALTLSIGKVTGDDLTTIKLAGSNNITISEFDLVQASGNNSAGVSDADRAKVAVEIDAIGTSGTVTLSSSETGFLNIKGGSGKLDVDLNGTATIEDTITGGAGLTDTLTVHDSTSAATFDPTTSGVEILQIETITGGAKTTSLKNTTGVTTVQIIDEVAGGGFGTTVSDINGQTIELVTHTASTTTDFSSAAIVLKVATGVTNVDVKFGAETNTTSGVTTNDGASLDGVVLSTDAGKFTITDAVVDNNATSGADDFENQVYEVAGTASTAKLTALVISGGGDTDTTTTEMDANTHTITASTNTAITSIDATGMVANLNIVSVALESGATVTTGAASTTTTVTGADLVADEVKFVDLGGDDTLFVTTNIGISGQTAIRVNSSGYETLDFGLEDDGSGTAAGAVTFDLRDAVGATTFNLRQTGDGASAAGAFDEDITISNLGSGSKVIFTGDDTDGSAFGTGSDTTTIDAAISGASSVVISNSAAAGTVTLLDLDFGTTYTTVTVAQEAEQDFDFTDIAGTKVTTLNLGAANSVSGTAIADADIDIATATFGEMTTLNIDSNAGDITFGSSALSAAKLATLNIVGDKNVGFGASSGSTTTLLADVNASTATGNITFGSSVGFTAAADIATGTGDDTVNLVVTVNTATSLSLGEKASDNDTVNITGANGLGLTIIDLSAADQIIQLNGSNNTAVQTGIESINLSGLTGSFGAQITGSDDANTITGTKNTDVISAGKGADIITSTAGNDVVTLGDGVDTVVIASAGHGLRITDFVAGVDDLDINITLVLDDGTTVAAGAGTAFLTVTGAAGDNVFQNAGPGDGEDVIFEFSNAAEVFSGNFATMTDSDLAAAIVTELDSTTDFTTANVGQVVVILYDNQGTANSVVALIDVDGTQGTLAASEISILAVLEGVGADALSAVDFI